MIDPTVAQAALIEQPQRQAPKKKEPRYYQLESVEATLAWWDNTGRKALDSMWVGTGKTYCAALLCRRVIEDAWSRGHKTPKILFIGHRQELINQPYRTFREEFLKEVIERRLKVGRCGGYGGSMHYDYAANIICCSIQSLIQRKKASKHLATIIKHQAPDVVIIDEAHRSIADSYLKLIETCEEANPGLLVKGITATPDRADEQSMGILFEKCMELDTYTYFYDYERALADRVSVPYLQFEMKTELDVGKMRMGGSGFYSQNSMTDLWDAGNPADLIIEGWLQQDGVEQTTIAFMPSVEVSAAFIRHLGKHYGIEGGHISAEGKGKGAGVWRWSNAKQEMVKAERADLLKKFEKGAIPIISNFYVLVEGYDNPRIKRLIMALPTNSPGAEIQMIGRATRPYPGPFYELGDEKAVLLYVGYRGHSYKSQNSLGGYIPEKLEKEVKKVEDKLAVKPDVLMKVCDQCGSILQSHPQQRGKLYCAQCQMTFELGNGDDFIELVDRSRPTGKSVHFEAITQLAKSEVRWLKEDGYMSVGLGVNGSYDRCLFIAPPGKCPGAGDRFALIGIYRKIKSKTRVGGRFGYWKYSFEQRKHALIESSADLDVIVKKAEELAGQYAQAILAKSDKKWRKEPVKPDSSQWKELARLGYDPDKLTKGDGSAIQTLCYNREYLRKQGVID